jgi:hypothetical protein
LFLLLITIGMVTIGVVLLLALFYYRRCYTIGIILLLVLFYYRHCISTAAGDFRRLLLLSLSSSC